MNLFRFRFSAQRLVFDPRCCGVSSASGTSPRGVDVVPAVGHHGRRNTPKLMGLTANPGQIGDCRGPLDVGAKLWEHLKRGRSTDNGPNDKGLGIQLGYFHRPRRPSAISWAVIVRDITARLF